MNRKMLFIAGLGVLFLLSVWYFTEGLLYRPAPQATTAKEKDKKAAKGAETAPETLGVNYEIIAGRNIFSPERKAVDKQAADAAKQAAQQAAMPDLALKGIVQGPDGEFIAYVSIDKKKAVAMRAGERIDALKAVSVTASDVVITWSPPGAPPADVKLTLIKVKSIVNKR